MRKEYHIFFKRAGYIFLLFLLEVHFVARLPHRGLRVDLLLPAMIGVALLSSTTKGLLAAFVCGYVVDVLSGKFWGLHIVTYMTIVWLVKMTAQKVEFRNPLYQMPFVFLCVLAQSAVLGTLLWIKAPVPFIIDSLLKDLGIRSLTTMLVAPMVISPLLKIR